MKTIVLAMFAFLLLDACNSKKTDTKIDFNTAFSYYASPMENEGEATFLTIQEGAKVELYRGNDTLRSDLTNDEINIISAAISSISVWDTTYESKSSYRFETITRLNKQGIATLKRIENSDAPKPVVDLLKECAEITKRLRGGSVKKTV